MNHLRRPSLLRHILLVSPQRNGTKLGSNVRYLCDKVPNKTGGDGDGFDEWTPKVSGFAKAYESQEKTIQDEQKPKEEPIQSFATMLRNSKFVDLGDPENKVVTGNIFHVVGDDLYIDFGWKFHCVCQRPIKNSEGYIRGAKVRLRVKDLELSTKFLGSEKDLTIMEADCHLLGLISTSGKSEENKMNVSV